MSLGTIVSEGSRDAGKPVGFREGTSGRFAEIIDTTPEGTWTYKAGADGTYTATGKRVLSVACVAGGLGATVTINGGDPITLAAGQSWELVPRGFLLAPSFVFTGTTQFVVEMIG